jgi:hypothetical protein
MSAEFFIPPKCRSAPNNNIAWRAIRQPPMPALRWDAERISGHDQRVLANAAAATT